MTEPNHQPPDVTIVLRAVADPLVRAGLPERDMDYRLKLALKTLLRQFGLKCIACRDVQAGEPGEDTQT